MAFPNGKIELDPYMDPVLGTCYVGQSSGPGTLLFKKGVIFFVFLSEEGSEEVHIGCVRPGSKCNAIGRTHRPNGAIEKYVVELQPRQDEEGATYFMAVVQDDNLELDFDDGFKFMVVSKNGKTELHLMPLRAPGFKITLDPRRDAQDQVFWVGRNQWDLVLHLNRGVAFSIRLSDDGLEEIEISRPKNNDKSQSFRRRMGFDGTVDKYIVSLEHRLDDRGKPYYYGVVQEDLNLNFEDGYVFLVFTSKQGKEELQISKNREASIRDNGKNDSQSSYLKKTDTGEVPRETPRRNSQVA